jgi:hypothetical protein
MVRFDSLKENLETAVVLFWFVYLLSGCEINITGQGISYPKTQNMQNYQKSEITERYGNSLRKNISCITVLVLRGSYEEMGEACSGARALELPTNQTC